MPAAPPNLCDVHEEMFRRDWAPHGISRAEAVSEAAVTFDLLSTHAHLARGLNGWLGHGPGWDGDVHEHVNSVLRANTERITADTILIRLAPRDVLALSTSGRREREDVLIRAATGTSAYRCPAVAALAWQLSGVEPEVANRFETRLSGDGPTHCLPTSRDEVVEAPQLHPLTGWLDARAWQRWLSGNRDTQLDSAALADVADRLDHDYAYLRRPASLQAYEDAGFPTSDAVVWHRLLVSTGLVGDSDAAACSAARFRDHGFDPQTLTGWLGTSPTALRGRSLFERDAQTHATLRNAGFTDLDEALPWVLLWTKYAESDFADLAEIWANGTPVEWAEKWLASQDAV
jgi:hypothetical protein